MTSFFSSVTSLINDVRDSFCIVHVFLLTSEIQAEKIFMRGGEPKFLIPREGSFEGGGMENSYFRQGGD